MPPYVIQSQPFKADLNAEQIIHDQITKCNMAFMLGDLIAIKFTVLALQNLLIPSLNKENHKDQAFLNDLLGFEDDLDKRYQTKLAVHNERLIGCVAPGLMKLNAPSKEPDFQHWRLVFMRMLDLCHEKNMWLKRNMTVHWSNDSKK